MARWPGEPGFSTFADRGNAATTIDGPSSAISTMYVKYDGSADIDPLSNPVGSLTVSPAPAEVILRNRAKFLLRCTGTIPAGGSKTITHVYTMGGTLAATQALASEAEDSLGGPRSRSPRRMTARRCRARTSPSPARRRTTEASRR